jgi:hypothetical protein
MPLFFQNVHHPPDRHWRRRSGQPIANLVHRRLTPGEDNVHDLPLPAAERNRVRHGKFSVVVKFLAHARDKASTIRYFFNCWLRRAVPPRFNRHRGLTGTFFLGGSVALAANVIRRSAAAFDEQVIGVVGDAEPPTERRTTLGERLKFDAERSNGMACPEDRSVP